MKFYCKNCASVFEPSREFYSWAGKRDGGTNFCPVCGKETAEAVPDYETVEQWEARTGRKYPDTAPVYARVYAPLMEGDKPHWFWEVQTWSGARGHYQSIFVATEAGAPSDGWRPE